MPRRLRSEVGDNSFGVLDKPEENRLLIVHASNFYRMDEWRQGATTFLQRGERKCDITQTHLVTPRQIEFYYLCE